MATQVKTTRDVKPQVEENSRVDMLIKRFQSLKGQRAGFETYWQSLHDYFYIEAADVNTSYYPGNELSVNSLYDSTTLESADVLASGFMNYLTPPTSKWFSLMAKNPMLQDSQKINAYLDDVAEQVNYTLNKSNFYNEMFSSYKSSGVYGTSSILEEEDDETDARFYTLPIKQVCIVEDGLGRITEFYIEFEYTAYQAASRWGREALDDNMKKDLDGTRENDKKYPFVLFIGKRAYRDVRKSDKENLPIEALWIDVKNKKLVNVSGYNDMPAFCHRFDKRPFIPWGFSPAMKTLPFARMLNAIAKTNLRAMMKQTDPPVALPDDAFIMPFNANPRAINYYNKNKMEGSKDIFAFANYGNPQVGMTAVEYYKQEVRALMYNDIFLAFQGLTKQMNNPEVMERINEKMALLGPAVGRYISEMLNPIIIRTIGILARKGKLPPPPDEFMQDPSYEIDSISQLAQAQRRSELNSLATGLTMVGQMAEFDPSVLDKIDPDKVVTEAWSIVGAPERVLRSDDDVVKIRAAKAEAMAQQQELNMIEQGAGAAEKGSKVNLNEAKARKERAE